MKNWKELNMYGSSNDRLEAFLGSKENAFAILQLDDSEESIYDRFESLANLRKRCEEALQLTDTELSILHHWIRLPI